MTGTASKQDEPATPRAPGMTDVARLAGVSAQTVSRTLSGHPNVQAATRAKVLAAVEQLGYRRNNAARALSSGRSRALGVVTLRIGFYSRTALAAPLRTERTPSGSVRSHPLIRVWAVNGTKAA